MPFEVCEGAEVLYAGMRILWSNQIAAKED